MSDLEKMTKKAQAAMQAAAKLAEHSKNPTVEPLHLLSALVRQPGGIVPDLLKKLQISLSSLRDQIDQELGKLGQVTGDAKVFAGKDLVQIFNIAEREAQAIGDSYISTEHFLIAILKDDKTGARKLLEKCGVTLQKILGALKESKGDTKVVDDDPESKFDVLSKYAKDLTDLAENGKLDPIIGRDEEIRRVIQVLARRTKNNPVLIGEPGVGKTAIAEGLALRIINQDVPEVLIGKKVMSLDLGALLAGAKYRGRKRF